MLRYLHIETTIARLCEGRRSQRTDQIKNILKETFISAHTIWMMDDDPQFAWMMKDEQKKFQQIVNQKPLVYRRNNLKKSRYVSGYHVTRNRNRYPIYHDAIILCIKNMIQS